MLRVGTTSSKGKMMQDLVGRRFGLLDVISFARVHRWTSAKGTVRTTSYWVVRCVCGNQKEVQAGNLTSGQIVSCGCKKLGFRGTPPVGVPGCVWIPLAGGDFALVDAADAPLLMPCHWRVIKGYAVRTVNHRMVSMHREILHPQPEEEVDHINGNRLDNRRSNMRLATRHQNAKNAPAPRSNTSGVKGVSWDKTRGRWVARIRIGPGRRLELGRFVVFEDAVQAYNEAAHEHHGVFVCIKGP